VTSKNLWNPQHWLACVWREGRSFFTFKSVQRHWLLPFASAIALGSPVLAGAWRQNLNAGMTASLGALVFLYLPQSTFPHMWRSIVWSCVVMLPAQHVPYKGDAPALQDLAGGQLPLAALAPSLSLPFVRDGKLVPLAVTSDKRLPQLPNVPTLKELGYSPNGVYAWQGMVVPKNTPNAVVTMLSRELQAAMSLPAVRQKLGDLGMEPIASDAAAMDAHVRAEKKFWEEVINARGIKAD
jgi:hypothetical protein